MTPRPRACCSSRRTWARYNRRVITHRIRDFMGRDWRAARMAKDSYWGERVARLGPAEAWRVAEELRQQALRQIPAWPDELDRQADFQAHVRLTTLFQRADSARRP